VLHGSIQGVQKEEKKKKASLIGLNFINATIYIYSKFNEILLQGEGVLAYLREEIRLPACEMMVLKYDFGIFEMMATVRAFLVFSF
jgi:hypothetical protein